MNSVGTNFRFDPFVVQRLSSRVHGPVYNGNNRNYYYIDYTKDSSKTSAKEDVRKLRFLQSFYVDLNNGFNLKKFNRKYAKTLDDNVKKELSKTAQSDTADVHRGWQIFNGEPANYRYVIRFADDSWLSITAQDNYSLPVFVKLRQAPKGKRIIISGIRNEYRKIEINE